MRDAWGVICQRLPAVVHHQQVAALPQPLPRLVQLQRVTSDYIDPSRSDNAGAAFVNGIFCSATVAYTYYASQITGFGNGTHTWQVDRVRQGPVRTC